MTSDELQILKHVFEQMQLLTEALEQLRPIQSATAKAVRDLASGLSQSEKRQQSDDRALARLEAVVAGALASLEKLAASRDVREMSAEDIAQALGIDGFDRLCSARQILWARKHEHRGMLPVPPPPSDLQPVVIEGPPPPRKKRRDDSVTVRTGADGDTHIAAKIKVKTLLAWLVGGAVALFEAYHHIKDAWNGL